MMSTSNVYCDGSIRFRVEENFEAEIDIPVFTSIGALIFIVSSFVLGDIPMYDL